MENKKGYELVFSYDAVFKDKEYEFPVVHDIIINRDKQEFYDINTFNSTYSLYSNRSIFDLLAIMEDKITYFNPQYIFLLNELPYNVHIKKLLKEIREMTHARNY